MSQEEDASLAAKIRAMINLSGLRYGQVAERAGMTASQISDLTAGRYVPSLPTLRRVAAACGREVRITFQVIPR
jgi:transcriptional regulator with XRE-family HTH domain